MILVGIDTVSLVIFLRHCGNGLPNPGFLKGGITVLERADAILEFAEQIILSSISNHNSYYSKMINIYKPNCFLSISFLLLCILSLVGLRLYRL